MSFAIAEDDLSGSDVRAAFEPALALYRGYGLVDCPPFADYRPDPFSRFMTLEL